VAALEAAGRLPVREVFATMLPMDGSAATADVFAPTTAEELARFVSENAAGERRALFPVGGRTALHYGYPLPEGAVTLTTSELAGIIDYPARDMTITVEAGLRIEDLQKTLASEHQRLPIDIPQAHRATVGGAIATNTCGPGRFAWGTLRDYVIGITAIDGTGRLFSAGGRVVKNVAGYDLCKLLVGSMGTLAVITSVTFKLRPQPAARKCLWVTFNGPDPIDAALERLLSSQTRPTALEVLNPRAVHQVQRESKLDLATDRFVLCLAWEGSNQETAWQVRQAQGELKSMDAEEVRVVSSEEGTALWSALTEYQAASDDPLTFQAGVPPSEAMALLASATETDVAVQCHAGNGILIGHLPDRCSTVEAAAEVVDSLRQRAVDAGGSLVVLACDEEWKTRLSLFGKRGNAAALDRRVKAALDPENLLSPGRLGP
jgi:glycolate oxidase FAD binding subunit